MPNRIAREQPRLRPALDRLYQVLTPPAERHDCQDGTGGCFRYGDVELRVSETGLKLDDPLATAATMAEDLALEYEENMPSEQVGWGRADLPAIEEIMAIHTYSAHLTRENKIVASHHGARLMQSVLRALEGPAAMKIFVGHDTNLGNLAAILDVGWVLPGQAEPTPPGGILAFERWRDDKGEIFIKLRVYYQTPQQLRHAEAMERPGQVDIILNNCHDGPQGSCPLPHLVALMSEILPKECVALTP